MLAFVDVVERKETITIDGYTTNKRRSKSNTKI